MLMFSLISASVLVFGLTLWSDTRLCRNRSQVLPLMNEVVTAPCYPSDDYNGKIVHIDCELDTRYTFYTPKEFSSNIYSYSGAFFDTQIEMYQWVDVVGFFGVYKVGAFVDHPVKNDGGVGSLFMQEKNPGFFPHVPGAGRKFAPKLKLGGYTIPKGAFVSVKGRKQLPLIDDQWYQSSPLTYPLPVPEVDHLNTQVYNNALYTGDPLDPKIGDIRITFWGNETMRFSAIGRQQSSMFPKEYSLEPFPLLNHKVLLLGEGGGSALSLATQFYTQYESTQTVYWSLRMMSALLIASTIYVYYRGIKAPKNGITLLLCSLCASATAICLTESVIWFSYRFYISFLLAVLGSAFCGALISIWRMDPSTVWQLRSDDVYVPIQATYDSMRWSTASPTTSIAMSSDRPLINTMTM